MKKNSSNSAKKTIVKNEIPAIVPPIKSEEKKGLISINLSKFTDQLKNVELKEKKIRETLYIYPDGKGKEWINSPEGKKWRNSKRNQLRRHSNNVLTFAKIQEMEKLQKEIELFNLFYKENFRINDYSFSSISQSSNEGKEKDLSLMMQIIKECITIK